MTPPKMPNFSVSLLLSHRRDRFARHLENSKPDKHAGGEEDEGGEREVMVIIQKWKMKKKKQKELKGKGTGERKLTNSKTNRKRE